MTKHIYKINVSNYASQHTAEYTNKADALKAARAIAKDWSSFANTGWSLYIDGAETPAHEGYYIDGKPMLGR